MDPEPAVTQFRTIAAAIGLSALAGASPALANRQIYTYAVVHPIYGDIGTLTATVDHSTDEMRVDSRLSVTVKLLGLVVFRQETDITETIRGNRLVSLQSVTERDGRHFEVHGAAEGDRFVVNGTSGSFAGPATVAPSDPWFRWRTGEATVIFTDTGRIATMQISGGGYDRVAVNGAMVSARHFVAMGFKRQEVWLDDRGIPVMFRSVDYGAPIDFVLRNAVAAAGAVTFASMDGPAPVRPADAGR
jgi:hypothetical protein